MGLPLTVHRSLLLQLLGTEEGGRRLVRSGSVERCRQGEQVVFIFVPVVSTPAARARFAPLCLGLLGSATPNAAAQSKPCLLPTAV